MGPVDRRLWENRHADPEIIEAELPGYLQKMLQSYEEIETANLEKIKGTGVKVIEADREGFGPAVDQWYEEWRKKSPLLEKLDAEAGKL